jgi:diamine N-acetyltransferase
MKGKQTMKMPLKIRRIESNELSNCLDVIHKSFATVADKFGLTEDNCPAHTSFLKLEKLQNHFDWGWSMFGLYENEQIIGYFSLSKTAEQEYELHNLAVLPEFRHCGCGKMLLDYAKERVGEQGGNKIKIGIIDENTVLKNWYEVNGFVHTGAKRFEHLPFTAGFMECVL